jgi:hypothetical protein
MSRYAGLLGELYRLNHERDRREHHEELVRTLGPVSVRLRPEQAVELLTLVEDHDSSDDLRAAVRHAINMAKR